MSLHALAQSSNDATAIALVKKMTLEEKVGQMTQVTLAVIAKGAWANTDGSLDPDLLKAAINKYKVGSILNTTAHALPVALGLGYMAVIRKCGNGTARYG